MLRESLALVDPGTDKMDKLLHVLNGSHALLPYAVEFWLEHLLDCATAINITPDSPLGLLMANFHSSHMRAAQKLNKVVTVGLPSQPSADTRLAALSHLSIGLFCTSILAFREECKEKSAGSGEGKYI